MKSSLLFLALTLTFSIVCKCQVLSKQMQSQHKATPTDSIIKIAWKKVSPAAVTTAGYKSYTWSNKVTVKEIEQDLMKNGMTRKYAKGYAEDIFTNVKGKIFKRFTVVVTAAAGVYTFEELIFPKLSLAKKISIALAFGVVMLFLFGRAQKRGIAQ